MDGVVTHLNTLDKLEDVILSKIAFSIDVGLNMTTFADINTANRAVPESTKAEAVEAVNYLEIFLKKHLEEVVVIDLGKTPKAEFAGQTMNSLRNVLNGQRLVGEISNWVVEFVRLLKTVSAPDIQKNIATQMATMEFGLNCPRGILERLELLVQMLDSEVDHNPDQEDWKQYLFRVFNNVMRDQVKVEQGDMDMDMNMNIHTFAHRVKSAINEIWTRARHKPRVFMQVFLRALIKMPPVYEPKIERAIFQTLLGTTEVPIDRELIDAIEGEIRTKLDKANLYWLDNAKLLKFLAMFATNSLQVQNHEIINKKIISTLSKSDWKKYPNGKNGSVFIDKKLFMNKIRLLMQLFTPVEIARNVQILLHEMKKSSPDKTTIEESLKAICFLDDNGDILGMFCKNIPWIKINSDHTAMLRLILNTLINMRKEVEGNEDSKSKQIALNLEKYIERHPITALNNMRDWLIDAINLSEFKDIPVPKNLSQRGVADMSRYFSDLAKELELKMPNLQWDNNFLILILHLKALKHKNFDNKLKCFMPWVRNNLSEVFLYHSKYTWLIDQCDYNEDEIFDIIDTAARKIYRSLRLGNVPIGDLLLQAANIVEFIKNTSRGAHTLKYVLNPLVQKGLDEFTPLDSSSQIHQEQYEMLAVLIKCLDRNNEFSIYGLESRAHKFLEQYKFEKYDKGFKEYLKKMSKYMQSDEPEVCKVIKQFKNQRMSVEKMCILALVANKRGSKKWKKIISDKTQFAIVLDNLAKNSYSRSKMVDIFTSALGKMFTNAQMSNIEKVSVILFIKNSKEPGIKDLFKNLAPAEMFIINPQEMIENYATLSHRVQKDFYSVMTEKLVGDFLELLDTLLKNNNPQDGQQILSTLIVILMNTLNTPVADECKLPDTAYYRIASKVATIPVDLFMDVWNNPLYLVRGKDPIRHSILSVIKSSKYLSEKEKGELFSKSVKSETKITLNTQCGKDYVTDGLSGSSGKGVRTLARRFENSDDQSFRILGYLVNQKIIPRDAKELNKPETSEETKKEFGKKHKKMANIFKRRACESSDMGVQKEYFQMEQRYDKIYKPEKPKTLSALKTVIPNCVKALKGDSKAEQKWKRLILDTLSIFDTGKMAERSNRVKTALNCSDTTGKATIAGMLMAEVACRRNGENSCNCNFKDCTTEARSGVECCKLCLTTDKSNEIMNTVKRIARTLSMEGVSVVRPVHNWTSMSVIEIFIPATIDTDKLCKFVCNFADAYAIKSSKFSCM